MCYFTSAHEFSTNENFNWLQDTDIFSYLSDLQEKASLGQGV